MNKLNILAFLVLFASCQSTNKENPEDSVQVESQTITLNDIQVKNAGIAIGKLEKKTLSRLLNVSGKIDVPPQNILHWFIFVNVAKPGLTSM